MQRTEEGFVTTAGIGHVPVNQMSYFTNLVTANFTNVVTPNANTLYNTVCLELGKEPIVLHVPDTNGCYYVQQMLDAYTNTFNSMGNGPLAQDKASLPLLDLIGPANCPHDSR